MLSVERTELSILIIRQDTKFLYFLSHHCPLLSDAFHTKHVSLLNENKNPLSPFVVSPQWSTCAVSVCEMKTLGEWCTAGRAWVNLRGWHGKYPWSVRTVVPNHPRKMRSVMTMMINMNRKETSHPPFFNYTPSSLLRNLDWGERTAV